MSSGDVEATFSIVVPTRGRPRELAGCLAALARLEYPRQRYEVVVAVDGADSATERAVAEAGSSLELKLAVQAHAGAAVARNAGVARAEGEFIAFTDDDCLAEPGWLGALCRRLEGDPGAAVGGRTLNGVPENLCSAASQAVIDAAHAHWNRDRASPRFYASNNLALPAEGFRAIGGFDAGFRSVGGEDRDFCDRWLGSGRRLGHAPEAVVHHFKQLTLGAFLQQHFRYGQGARRFHRARAVRGGRRNVPEPGFYAELVRQGAAQANGLRRLPLAGLLAASQAANAAGYFLERDGRR